MASNITTELNVFGGVNAMGGCQSITLVNDRRQLNAFIPPNMRENVDYSIVYFNKDTAYVTWRNHQGSVQFCGSGAYALSMYLFEHYQIDYLTIESPHIRLAATNNGQVCLHIPVSSSEPVFIDTLSIGDVYHHQNSGIYFIHMSNLRELTSLEWGVEAVLALPLNDPHAVCLYYWDDVESIGYLRYFTPWHGRNEDVVTGSVQRYLTPLVAKQVGVHQQRWHQCSRDGGSLQTDYNGAEVLLLAQPA